MFTFPGDGDSLIKLWNQATKIPLGKLLFSRVLGKAIPYTGSIMPQIDSIEKGRAVVILKDTRAVRNHLSSVHAIALANIGELATGLALISQLPKGMRAILGSIKVDYLKKARGELRAQAICDLLDTGDKFERLVIAEIFDAANVCVSRVEAKWVVGKDRR